MNQRLQRAVICYTEYLGLQMLETVSAPVNCKKVSSIFINCIKGMMSELTKKVLSRLY